MSNEDIRKRCYLFFKLTEMNGIDLERLKQIISNAATESVKYALINRYTIDNLESKDRVSKYKEILSQLTNIQSILEIILKHIQFILDNQQPNPNSDQKSDSNSDLKTPTPTLNTPLKKVVSNLQQLANLLCNVPNNDLPNNDLPNNDLLNYNEMCQYLKQVLEYKPYNSVADLKQHTETLKNKINGVLNIVNKFIKNSNNITSIQNTDKSPDNTHIENTEHNKVYPEQFINITNVDDLLSKKNTDNNAETSNFIKNIVIISPNNSIKPCEIAYEANDDNEENKIINKFNEYYAILFNYNDNNDNNINLAETDDNVLTYFKNFIDNITDPHIIKMNTITHDDDDTDDDDDDINNSGNSLCDNKHYTIVQDFNNYVPLDRTHVSIGDLKNIYLRELNNRLNILTKKIDDDYNNMKNQIIANFIPVATDYIKLFTTIPPTGGKGRKKTVKISRRHKNTKIQHHNNKKTKTKTKTKTRKWRRTTKRNSGRK